MWYDELMLVTRAWVAFGGFGSFYMILSNYVFLLPSHLYINCHLLTLSCLLNPQEIAKESSKQICSLSHFSLWYE